MTSFQLRAKPASRASLFAALSSGVSLFAIFRLGVLEISASAIGCWSLIQGLFVVTRVADSGAGANVTRYVAARLKSSIGVSLPAVLLSTWVLGSLPVGIVGTVIVWPIAAYVTHQYGSAFSGAEILHLSLSCLAFASISSTATIVLAVVEGTGRLAAKSYILVGANSVGAALAYPLIRYGGLLGVGLTYVAIALAQLAGGIVAICVLARTAQRARQNPWTIGRELWKENAQLSLAGLLRLGLEPMTKLLLSFVASLPVIAAFELALRVATQLRTVLQAGVQPLLAMGSRSKVGMELIVRDKFDRADKLMSKLITLVFVGEMLIIPIVSWAGLGVLDIHFILFSLMLILSNSFSSRGLVGYYYQLSSGKLAPLVRIQSVMMAMNAGFGALAALTFGAPAVVAAYALSFIYNGYALVKLYAQQSNSDVRGNRLLGWMSGVEQLVCLASMAIGVAAIWSDRLLGTMGTLISYSIIASAGSCIFASRGGLQWLGLGWALKIRIARLGRGNR